MRFYLIEMFVCVSVCVCTDRNPLASSLRRKYISETFHLCLRSQSLWEICWRTLILQVWLPYSLLTMTIAERITVSQYPPWLPLNLLCVVHYPSERTFWGMNGLLKWGRTFVFNVIWMYIFFSSFVWFLGNISVSLSFNE